MYQITEVGAFRGADCQLITTKQKTALVDSGFGFCAPVMIKNLKDALCGRTLDYIILTHSHYDHAGGCTAVKKEYPAAQVLSGEYAAAVFKKEGARKTMNEMDAAAARLHDTQPAEGCFDGIVVDRAVKDGDIVDMGDMQFEVWETPGHTKCTIALAETQGRVFFSNETIGPFVGEPLVMPNYLVSCKSAIAAIKRAAARDFAAVQVPHYYLLRGKQAKRYLDSCLYWAETVRDIICERHTAGQSNREIIDWFYSVFFTPACSVAMPKEAFMLNASYLVPMVIKETLGE
jgi:glyoxylase-like metal-dependent hydrolase (beta-lactamase superfamily II)